MTLALFHRILAYAVIPCVTLFLFSCGPLPTSLDNTRKTGTLELRTFIVKNGLSKSTMAGIGLCDSLIVEISGPEITPLRYARLFDLSSPVGVQTFQNIPTGTDRTIRVYTVDKAGTTIHLDSIALRGVRIDPNVVTPVTVMLIPAVGSLFIQLQDIPTTVDTVIASFTANGRQPWVVRAKRASKMYLALEKIPHNTRGLLRVAAVGLQKDTLYSATKELTFNACGMDNIALNFSSAPGTLSFDVGVMLPGATNATGSMLSEESDGTESGELIITEIMYAANDSEYVEVYNPGDTDRSYDTLVVDLDGTKRVFTGVTIAAKRAYVFGRRLFAWTDAAHPTASALDLSGNGNWITIRNKTGAILDRVIFAGGSNTQEWPNVSGKRSIILDASINDPGLNNFGRNWKAATSLIEGTDAQYGTPKIR